LARSGHVVRMTIMRGTAVDATTPTSRLILVGLLEGLVAGIIFGIIQGVAKGADRGLSAGLFFAAFMAVFAIGYGFYVRRREQRRA